MSTERLARLQRNIREVRFYLRNPIAGAGCCTYVVPADLEPLVSQIESDIAALAEAPLS